MITACSIGLWSADRTVRGVRDIFLTYYPDRIANHLDLKFAPRCVLQ